ncbi:MAG: hypothetical protein E7609_05100 [Ruminococcaceae bacterium]|nr:hypothetical protein [Oscillospiraceae bacterium]
MLVKDLRSIVLHKPMLREMEFTLATERCYGEKLIKFITRSETAALLLRRSLRKLQEQGRICFFIPGQDFHPDDQSTQYLLNIFPQVEKDKDLGKKNADITVVCLYLH